MTSQLEKTFDLPAITEIKDKLEEMRIDPDIPIEIKDKIDSALGFIVHLEDDTEINELIAEAKKGYKELMDAGNNMDPRFSGKLFEVAASLLANAITAQVHKNDRKLRVVDMQIKKKRLDMQKDALNNNNSIPGQARVVDRNELIKQHKQAKTDK